jgi:hypothetical protein
VARAWRHALEHIERAVQALGDTPEAVATTLRAAGVRGLRDSASFLNPLVRYLNRTLDIGGRLEVDAGGELLRLLQGNKVSELALPAAVQAFLDRFHAGLYPELEGA